MPTSRRRGSVVILAVAVVALLFILGSVLLFTSSQSRQVAIQVAETAQIRAAHDALTSSALLQLRQDAVGSNGRPYDGQ
jgi:CHASE3 domain sensor protein